MQLSQSLITVSRDEWKLSGFTSPHAKALALQPTFVYFSPLQKIEKLLIFSIIFCEEI